MKEIKQNPIAGVPELEWHECCTMTKADFRIADDSEVDGDKPVYRY